MVLMGNEEDKLSPSEYKRGTTYLFGSLKA